MRRTAMIGTALFAAAAAAATDVVPTGARIEPSGFATILRAPPVPLPAAPPPPVNLPNGPVEWYARENGISVEESERRHREQRALQPEFERLIALLKLKEAGNFVAPSIQHKPDWAYVLHFKRDPEQTLAKYTSHPRFKAVRSPYTEAYLRALAQPWLDRFAKHKIARGFGLDVTGGTMQLMMSVTEPEYRTIAAREGWGEVPKPLVLGFAGSQNRPAVEKRAEPLIRIFAQNDRSAGVKPERGEFGRVVLRDGCLYTGKALAYFHNETAVGVDEHGYLALKDRRTGKSKGRIGEWFSWAGPNRINEDMPMIPELRQRCGDAPIYNVGNPESAALARLNGAMVDRIAERRNISRQRAWSLLKQCWARRDAAKPKEPPFDMDCVG